VGRYLYIGCKCGTALANRVSRRFESAVLKDGLELRFLLAIDEPPVPWGPLDGDQPMAAADFVGWHEDTVLAFRLGRDALPVLHQIWLRNPAGGAGSDLGYFEWHGEKLIAIADDDVDITVRPLDAEIFDTRVAWARGRGLNLVPRLEERVPGADLPPLPDGRRTRAAEVFEQLFDGTGVELERGDVLDYYASDFTKLAATADHAAACRRTLVAYWV
jgi:hypothetical protein